MNNAAEFVKNFLAHYASEYYDPVKAREYYLENRDLKGRQPAKDLKNDKQKQAWNYAKKQIGDAQKGELATARFLRDVFIKRSREEATARRKEWSEKLSGILGIKGLSGEKKQATDEIAADKKTKLDAIAKKEKEEAKKIAKEASDKIAALPPIPKGVSKERRQELAAERADEIAKIRGDASDKRADLKAASSLERESVSEDAANKQETLNENVSQTREEEKAAVDKKREEITTGLKATVDKARADYETLKSDLKAKYEAASQNEYEAIKSKV
jgi:uncharacterized protein YdbL (DUF1318 family)